jgi:uncharacterized protein YkwD
MHALPTLIPVGVLIFGAGWVGGMWTGWSSPPEAVAPGPQDPPAAQPADITTKGAYLGIRATTFRRGDIEGVKILEVIPDSPAAQAGLRSDRDPPPPYLRQPGVSTGHIIIKANGRGIRSAEDLQQLLAQSVPRGVVKLLVTPGGGNSYEIIPVTLASIPDAPLLTQSSPAKRSLTGQRQEAQTETRIEEEIFRIVNRTRHSKGLSPLHESPRLRSLARRHSQDMATRDFFAHIDPEGHDVLERLRAEGLEDFTAVGENIFTGQKGEVPALLVVQTWLKSPGHRKNLLDPRYTLGGVGVAVGHHDRIYITQVYLER